MITALYHLQSLRWILPTTVLLGTAPFSISSWFVVRMLTLILPRRYYERADEYFIWQWYQRMLVFFTEHYTGLEVVFYGDAEQILKEHENAIFLCNHQTTVDWIITDVIAIREGSTSLGSVRYIVKDGLKYFPLFGFYNKQHGIVYIKRGRKFNEEKSRKDLQKFVDNKTCLWLGVFPEGTRFNPEHPKIIQKSREFAKEQGFPELEHVLTPRYKATQVSVEVLRDYVDVLYDVTIAYSDTWDPVTKKRKEAPSMIDIMTGQTRQVHIHMTRIDMKHVPSDPDTLKSWLHHRFTIKDSMLKRFYSEDERLHGRFEGQGRLSRLSHWNTVPALLYFVGMTGAILSTKTGRDIYWRIALYTSLGGILCMSIKS